MAVDEKTRKLTPEAVDDDVDRAKTEEEMDGLPEAIKHGIGLLDDDEMDEAEEKVRKKEEEEKEEIYGKDEDGGEESDEEDDEEGREESSEEDEDEDEEEQGEVKKKGKGAEVVIDEEMEKLLSPYQGTTDEKFKALAKSYKELQAKLSSYGAVNNLLKELNLGEADQQEVVSTVKDLREVAFHLNENVELLDLMDSVAKGQVPEKFLIPEKTVLDFMPEGQRDYYSANDADTDPTSLSWKAREQWEEYKSGLRGKREEIQKIITDKKSNLIGSRSKTAQDLDSIKANISRVRKKLFSEYGIGDVEWTKFQNDFQQLGPMYIEAAFAVFAHKNGIESSVSRKIRENSKKSSPEAEAKNVDVRSEAKVTERDRKKEKKMSSIFSDWDKNDGVIY